MCLVRKRGWGKRVVRNLAGNFRRCAEACKLEDLKYTGNLFTWSNKQQGEDRVYAKLDRVLVNSLWQGKFDNSEEVFLPEGTFDHCPIVVSFYKLEGHRKRPFKYYKMWSLAASFKDKVSESWSAVSTGVPMFSLVTKLKRLKHVLKKLNSEDFAQLHIKEEAAKLKKLSIQELLQSNPMNPVLIRDKCEARNHYVFCQQAHRSFLSQKTKIEWIIKGDENSTLFHAFLRARRSQNRVLSIRNAQGIMVETDSEIKQAFLQYYEDLLGSKLKQRRKVIRSIVQLGKLITAANKEAL